MEWPVAFAWKTPGRPACHILFCIYTAFLRRFLHNSLQFGFNFTEFLHNY